MDVNADEEYRPTIYHTMIQAGNPRMELEHQEAWIDSLAQAVQAVNFPCWCDLEEGLYTLLEKQDNEDTVLQEEILTLMREEHDPPLHIQLPY